MKRKARRRNDGIWWVEYDVAVDDVVVVRVDVVVVVVHYNVVGGDVEEGRA